MSICATNTPIVWPSIVIGTAVNIRVTLENRNVLIRAKRVWQQPGTAKGKPAWRYGLTFIGIGADDWDAVVRFCNHSSVTVENKAQQELDLVRMQADDVARLIPKKLQDHLLALLVQRGRLAPLNERTPLVQYSYGGVTKRNGKLFHRLSIHSRIHDEITSEIKAFDTRFSFDDEGSSIAIDE